MRKNVLHWKQIEREGEIREEGLLPLIFSLLLLISYNVPLTPHSHPVMASSSQSRRPPSFPEKDFLFFCVIIISDE